MFRNIFRHRPVYAGHEVAGYLVELGIRHLGELDASNFFTLLGAEIKSQYGENALWGGVLKVELLNVTVTERRDDRVGFLVRLDIHDVERGEVSRREVAWRVTRD